MADSASVTVGIDTILRGLDKTVKGLDTVTAKLTNLSKIKAPDLGKASTANIDKATAAAQKQAVQIQELANRQERARQAGERLAQSQQRLAASSAKLEAAQKSQAQTSQRAASASGKMADAHVKEFRAAERARVAQERFERQAASSLQRQRSGALFSQFQAQERAAAKASATRQREAKKAADAEIREAKRAEREMAQSRQRLISGFRSVGSVLTSVGTALTAGLTAPLVALGVVSTQSAVTLDSLKRGLATVAGSAAAAEEQLKRLREIAKLPGIGFEEAIQGSIRLQAVGFSAKEAEKDLIEFSNAIALTGGGREELQRVTVQLGQLSAKGKVVAQDLKPIIEAAPAVGQALLKAFGTVNSEDIQKLGISSQEFLRRLVSELGRLPRAAAGAKNSFENFRDSVFIASSAIGDALLPTLTELIRIAEPIILNLADAFRELPKPVKNAIVVLAGLLAIAGPALLALGGLVGILGSVASAVTAFTSAAAAVGGVAALLSGVGEVLLVIVAVLGVAAIAGAALFKAWQLNFGGIRDTVTRVLNIIQEGFNRVLPNILSLTEKVTKGIHAFWARFGPQITAIVETVFGVLLRRAEAVIEVVTNMVVAVTKLIDGDWRGAWDSFKRILEVGIRSVADLVGSFVRVVGLAVQELIKLLLSAVKKFVEVGTQFARSTVLGFVSFLTGNQATTMAVAAILVFLLTLPSKVQAAAYELGGAMASAAVEGFVDGIAGGQKNVPALTVPAFGVDPEIEKRSREQIQNALDARNKAQQKAIADTKKGEGAIRNAEESLNRARAERQKAADDQLLEQERIKNEQLLTANENGFKLQLIAFRQFLNERARLTSANIQLEIGQQKQIAEQALAQRDRLLARAATKGVPKTERLKAEAGATEADAKRIQALTTINRLQADQRAVVTELDQSLREFQKQQLTDTRRLEIEYAELKGSIEAALNSATDERFREELKALADAQDDLNKRERLFGDLLSAAQKEEIALAKADNQRKIDAIENIKTQEDALASLAAANELVRRARERQAQLEADITFQVEFRGLSEEQAIARRLEGERKLNDSLTDTHETIRQIVVALQARGVEPPRALIEFLNGIRTEVQGLAELPFVEQFRLAQQEFDRLNDERIQKIQEVERAVRNRTLAEVEGQILIRRLNGQYVADLERQAEILREIAAKSGQRDLQRQAQSAADTTKDAADQLASFSKQIQAAGKDAFRSGLSEFFSDILNRTKSAKEAALDLLNSIVQKVNDVIAENLSKSLFESIFGTGTEATGILDKIRGLFGGAPKAETVGTIGTEATETAGATAAAATLNTGAATAAGSLVSGGAAAATALGTAATSFATGLVGAGTTLVSSLAGSGATFASTVIGAAASFASIVASAAGSQAIGGIGSAAAGAAAGGLLPLNVSRGEGYIPPAMVNQFGSSFWSQLNAKRLQLSQAAGILRGPGTATSDSIPALAPEGSFILRADAVKYYSDLFLRRINSRRYAQGGIVSSIPDDGFGHAGGAGQMALKQVLVDARDNRLEDFLSHAEDSDFMVDWITSNRLEIRRRLNIKE
jgi:tape measure domain-containing protein